MIKPPPLKSLNSPLWKIFWESFRVPEDYNPSSSEFLLIFATVVNTNRSCRGAPNRPLVFPGTVPREGGELELSEMGKPCSELNLRVLIDSLEARLKKSRGENFGMPITQTVGILGVTSRRRSSHNLVWRRIWMNIQKEAKRRCSLIVNCDRKRYSI